MISLMLILVAVWSFVCGYFFNEAKNKGNAIVCFITSIILLLIGVPWFIDFLLEVLGWVL